MQDPVAPPTQTRRPRSRNAVARFFRERVRPVFSRRLARLATATVPYLYLGYTWLVWRTSRIEGLEGFRLLRRVVDEHDGAIALLWHEEVFTVAYGYAYSDTTGHTLASLGESGDLITRMLELCGFVVFRGGSTTGRSRRREGALRDMIEHMQSNRGVLYGITVDGSKGPAYRMKTGGVVIARECGKPIVLVRTWYRRCLRLPTWDRMAIPLPFNVIHYYAQGPYEVPPNAKAEDELERFTAFLESELIALAARSYDDAGQARPANLAAPTGLDAKSA